MPPSGHASNSPPLQTSLDEAVYKRYVGSGGIIVFPLPCTCCWRKGWEIQNSPPLFMKLETVLYCFSSIYVEILPVCLLSTTLVIFFPSGETVAFSTL